MVSMEWYNLDIPDKHRKLCIMGYIDTLNDAVMFRKHIFHVIIETREIMNTLLEDILYCSDNKYVYELSLYAPKEYNVCDNKESRILFLNKTIMDHGYKNTKETLFIMYEIHSIILCKLKKDLEFIDKTFERIKKIFT